ncbi:hypothetical protein [Polyangium aurulentum]|uniref:hypothetical protein n=1 Tax=Polyangium aurulentum TaxID=2567896 RepID=UPI0010ADB69A|nr:hypothetical protein [Polyangium aurulentum]UQA57908.1 hypothetical protein E8A73_042660 [Polyangium aurulentum]
MIHRSIHGLMIAGVILAGALVSTMASAAEPSPLPLEDVAMAEDDTSEADLALTAESPYGYWDGRRYDEWEYWRFPRLRDHGWLHPRHPEWDEWRHRRRRDWYDWNDWLRRWHYEGN